MNTISDLKPCLDEIKTLDNLFNHPGFRLIFIDDDGSMSLEGPFDEESRQKVQGGYRCISHVWGTADKTKDYAWEGHGITNVTWKVEVREEKRKRVMQVFKHHRGYWWMDVFCTNQEDENKPLDVMGDIYRNCRECVCLLDTICDVSGYTSEREVWKSMAEYVKSCLEVYVISNRVHEPDISGSITEGMGTIAENLVKKYGKYFTSIQHCNWFHRVWTWQEAVLPPKLLFCSEQAGSYKYDPFDHMCLKGLFMYNFKDIRYFDEYGHVGVSNMSLHECLPIIKSIVSITILCRERSNIWDNVASAFISTRKCTNKEDYVYGIAGILDVFIPGNLALDGAMRELEKGLQRHGIFIGCGRYKYSDPDVLSTLYNTIRPIDGITVLGPVYDIKTLGNFSPNVNVQDHKKYGEILYKNKYKHTDDWLGRRYKHVKYKYEMKKHTIFLENGNYNVGDVPEFTRIGRNGCTFESCGSGYKKNEIFEIVGNRVKVVGYIGKNGIGQWE
jgi:hypothetical protein